jgi:hypothetical protein
MLMPSSSTPAGRRRRRAGRHLGAAVVEAQPVEERAIARQPEHARLRVAGLGLGRDRPQLDRAEAERRQRRRTARVLVEAGGQPQRRRHRPSKHRLHQHRIASPAQPAGQRLRPRHRQESAQEAEAEVVRGLGRQPLENQPEQRPVEHARLVPRALAVRARSAYP